MSGRRAWPALRWSRPAHRLSLSMAAALVLLGVAGCSSDDAPARLVVEMTGFAFSPDTLHVAVGDTVVWVNRDVVAHTATKRDGGWDSGSVASNESWTHVADRAGETSYMCTLHPTMTGLIVAR